MYAGGVQDEEMHITADLDIEEMTISKMQRKLRMTFIKKLMRKVTLAA
jgi:predicted lipase